MTVGSPALAAAAHSSSDASETKISAVPEPAESPRYLHDERQTTQGSMTVGGRTLAFQAEAGVLADRPLVGVAGVPAIEALGICPVGSKRGGYQKRAQCAWKEMHR